MEYSNTTLNWTFFDSMIKFSLKFGPKSGGTKT